MNETVVKCYELCISVLDLYLCKTQCVVAKMNLGAQLFSCLAHINNVLYLTLIV